MSKTKKRVSFRLIPQAVAIARAYAVDAEGNPKPAAASLFGLLDGYDLSTPEGVEDTLAELDVRFTFPP